jgi:hypothetical protein
MSLATTLLKLAQLADAGAEMIPLLQAVRDGYTDEQWAQVEEEHPLICELITACGDVEAAVEALD